MIFYFIVNNSRDNSLHIFYFMTMDNKSNKSSSDEDDEGLDPRIQVRNTSYMYRAIYACTTYKGHQAVYFNPAI
jgi:hypothetical protein